MGDVFPTILSVSDLRGLLFEILPSDSDLEAFCIDHFPQVQKRFTNGLDRVAKLNLLLLHADADEILKRLRECAPDGIDAAARAVSAAGSQKLDGPRQPLFVHPLSSELDFRGREAELASMERRMTLDRPGIVALIGIGGSGKSVVVNRFLETVDWKAGSAPSGIFIWSFNWDPDVDAFLSHAYHYLCGAPSDATESLGHVYALCDKLRRSDRIVLVLDGLESVQHNSGAIPDRALRLFLQQLSTGCGKAIGIVTSRIPLIDLSSHRGSGYVELEIGDLSESAAAELLRARGVKGQPNELAELARRTGCHALSVSLLGSAISECFGGSLSGAAQLTNLNALRDLDASSRLSAILNAYEQLLSAESIALLERVAVFPRGATLKLLEDILREPGAQSMAGPLWGLDGRKLRAEVARLKQLRLLKEEVREGEAQLLAHPAIKDHFYGRLLAEGKKQAHHMISQHLKRQPGDTLPRTEAELDRLEEIIYHTRQAGSVEEAAVLFHDRMRPIALLAFHLGEYSRGERIARGFFQDGEISRPLPGLSQYWQCFLGRALGLYTQRLGYLDEAWHCLTLAVKLSRELGDSTSAAISLRDLSLIRIWQGRLKEAAQLAAESVALAGSMQIGHPLADAWATLAFARALLGDFEAARKGFAAALAAQGACDDGLHALRGIHHAEFLCRTGNLPEAIRLTQENLSQWLLDIGKSTRCRLLLADLNRRDGKLDEARQLLLAASRVALRSGWQEALCHAHLVGGRLELTAGRSTEARNEAEAGIELAQRCGFTLLRIELFLVESEALHAQGSPDAAARAREAYELALECGFHFGQADARALLVKEESPT